MIYHELASYYDALVRDDEATKQWVDFTQQYVSLSSTILELACGSGEISLALAKLGYKVDATDQSYEMIQQARIKQSDEAITFREMDMLHFEVESYFDAVLCYCDSINYLKNEDELLQVFKASYQCLNEQGTFLFDMHATDRLQEFQEEYIEEGYMDQIPYQWTILSRNQCLYQHFSFWTQQGILQENHVQTVFEPKRVESLFISCGFEVEIKTDFIKAGIEQGEKIFFIGRKKK